MNKQEREILRLQEVAKKLGVRLETLLKLRGKARTLRRYFEYQCNGCTREKLPFESWEEYDTARGRAMQWVEKRVAIVEKQIEKLCKTPSPVLTLNYYIQRDPRGGTLYLAKDYTLLDSENYSTKGELIA